MGMARLATIKRLAASLLKCGRSKIRIDPERIREAGEAITREDVRKLIRKGVVKKVRTERERNPQAKYRQMQKKRGRRRGPGRRKGAKGAREGQKTEWLKRIRAQRKLLSELREKGRIDRRTYRRVYRLAKGGMFRSKKHLLTYLREHELIKGEGK